MIVFIAIYEVIILAVLMILLNNMHNYNKTLNEYTQTRGELIQVSSLLKQSSDYLSHFARSYVVTADEKFKKQYMTVLDIRNGKKPRPLNYDTLYWDLPKDIRDEYHPLTSTIALASMIKNLPFTEYERDKLRQSEKESNNLVNLEVRAFNAMIGKFQNENGDYEIQGDINQKLAIELLHTPLYYKEKEKIMAPIDLFLLRVDARSKNDINIVSSKIEDNYYLFLFFVSVFIISNVFVFIFVRKKDIKDKKEKDILIAKEQELINQLESFNKNLQAKIEEKTKELNIAFTDIREINQQVGESIQCASLIQNSILPSPDILNDYVTKCNIIWNPKDTVGGDIYFVDTINENEVIIFFIDCTGHGVPGAFLTVLLRVIKDRAIKNYKTNHTTIGNILEYLYHSMGEILHDQPNFDFDGLVISYNKKTKKAKVASKDGYIFIQNAQRAEFVKLKRHQRFKLKSEYKFETMDIDISDEDYLYITTDGFIDQKGGEDGFPFGKNRFIKMLETYKDEPIDKNEELFMKDFNEYRQDKTRLDDIMLMSIKI